MVDELFLLRLRNFGITSLPEDTKPEDIKTHLMILNANLKHFFLSEPMNRDVFNC